MGVVECILLFTLWQLVVVQCVSTSWWLEVTLPSSFTFSQSKYLYKTMPLYMCYLYTLQRKVNFRVHKFCSRKVPYKVHENLYTTTNKTCAVYQRILWCIPGHKCGIVFGISLHVQQYIVEGMQTYHLISWLSVFIQNKTHLVKKSDCCVSHTSRSITSK